MVKFSTVLSVFIQGSDSNSENLRIDFREKSNMGNKWLMGCGFQRRT